MPEPKRPLKVFLCHASADKPAVHDLYQRLKGEVWIDPWLDAVKILPGQHWTSVIRQSLANADSIIILISNNSINREGFVQREMNYAWDLSLEKPRSVIYLIPLRLDDCEVPFDLRERQWADYFGEKKEETYDALLESLKLRHEQKLKLEAEEHGRREKAEKERIALEEKARKEAEEKARLEQAERAQRERDEQERKDAEAKERREAKDNARRETEERARIEKEKKEVKAAEIALQEKKNLEATQKAKLEKAERQTAQITILREALSKSFIALKSNLPKGVPFLKIAGVAGIVIALLWGGLWVIPKFNSLIPMVKATATQHPTKAITSAVFLTQSPMSTLTVLKPSETPQPSPTSTKILTLTVLPQVYNPHPDTSDYIDSFGVPMRFVAAGDFTMGYDDFDVDEKPAHVVYLDDFYIDKYEVTNSLYKACVDSQVCQPPTFTGSATRASYYGNSVYANYPMIEVSWNTARTYCEWRGGQLPTEAQWEKAARGTDGRIYPWGEQFGCDFANYRDCVGDTSEVGTYEKGVSPYGVYDLGGNVEEWVADWYSETYYQNSPLQNPLGPNSGTERIRRGGAWGYPYLGYLRSYGRYGANQSSINFQVGFRCADMP